MLKHNSQPYATLARFATRAAFLVIRVTCAALLGSGCGGAARGDGSAAPASAAPNGNGAEQAVETIEIIAIYRHHADAFTQGLEFHRGVLYESTGLVGHSTIRIVEPSTGRVLLRRDLPPELYAEGLTILGDRVYQLTLEAGRCLVYDAQTLEQVAERHYEGRGWGLSHDSESLIISDGTAVLRFVDPLTFAERRRVEVRDGDLPIVNLNELEMVEGELYANVWQTDRIARIDPANGRVLGWIDLSPLRAHIALTEPEAVLNGIAYDAGARRLVVTGKFWPLLFEIRRRP